MLATPASGSLVLPTAGPVTLEDPAPSRSQPTARAAEEPQIGTAHTMVASPSETNPAATAPPRRRSRAWIAGAIVAVVGVATVTAVIAGGRRSPTEPPSTTAVETRPEPVPTTPTGPVTPPPDEIKVPPPAVATAVTLRFAVEPAGATISIDGAAVKGGRITVPKDDAAHRLRISAPGFASHEEELRFDESQGLTVQLRRAGRPIGSQRARVERKVERIESKSPYEQ
jgi:hypothetical protein